MLSTEIPNMANLGEPKKNPPKWKTKVVEQKKKGNQVAVPLNSPMLLISPPPAYAAGENCPYQASVQGKQEIPDISHVWYFWVYLPDGDPIPTLSGRKPATWQP